jgi:hypothetical protein
MVKIKTFLNSLGNEILNVSVGGLKNISPDLCRSVDKQKGKIKQKTEELNG